MTDENPSPSKSDRACSQGRSPVVERSLAGKAGLVIGVVLAVWLIGWQPLGSGEPGLNRMAGVTALMAAWWMTEALPLAATALVPLALFPALGIATPAQTAVSYGDRMIFLFLGGFLVALAIEESGLHRRVALHIVKLMGDNPRLIVLGFMLATGLLSMWLSNTATALMMLPIATSVVLQADRAAPEGKSPHGFGAALMLSIAYASSIGGVATLIGTPPNIFFRSFYSETYPDLPEISFGGWMVLAVPLSATFLLVCWLTLVWLFRVQRTGIMGGHDVIAKELASLGPMRTSEWRMAGIFAATALLWIFREPVEDWGWGPALGLDAKGFGVDDSTVAILMGLVCFLLPAGGKERRPLLTWQATARVPWGILLLFGGGMALAESMQSSGLSTYVGQKLAGTVEGLPPLGMAAVMAFGMTWLTEVTSNLASVQMILPILGGAATELGVPPAVLMVPATLAASCAFMLPVATPPNAIVYASGCIRMRDMVLAGATLNTLTVVIVTLFIWLLGSAVGA